MQEVKKEGWVGGGIKIGRVRVMNCTDLDDIPPGVSNEQRECLDRSCIGSTGASTIFQNGGVTDKRRMDYDVNPFGGPAVLLACPTCYRRFNSPPLLPI
jgi:hypothetical protein